MISVMGAGTRLLVIALAVEFCVEVANTSLALRGPPKHALLPAMAALLNTVGVASSSLPYSSSQSSYPAAYDGELERSEFSIPSTRLINIHSDTVNINQFLSKSPLTHTRSRPRQTSGTRVTSRLSDDLPEDPNNIAVGEETLLKAAIKQEQLKDNTPTASAAKDPNDDNNNEELVCSNVNLTESERGTCKQKTLGKTQSKTAKAKRLEMMFPLSNDNDHQKESEFEEDHVVPESYVDWSALLNDPLHTLSIKYLQRIAQLLSMNRESTPVHQILAEAAFHSQLFSGADSLSEKPATLGGPAHSHNLNSQDVSMAAKYPMLPSPSPGDDSDLPTINGKRRDANTLRKLLTPIYGMQNNPNEFSGRFLHDATDNLGYPSWLVEDYFGIKQSENDLSDFRQHRNDDSDHVSLKDLRRMGSAFWAPHHVLAPSGPESSEVMQYYLALLNKDEDYGEIKSNNIFPEDSIADGSNPNWAPVDYYEADALDETMGLDKTDKHMSQGRAHGSTKRHTTVDLDRLFDNTTALVRCVSGFLDDCKSLQDQPVVPDVSQTLQFADNFATVPRGENGVQFADNLATVPRGGNGVQFADNTATLPRGGNGVQFADNFATVPRRENGLQFADNFATVPRRENGLQFADNFATVQRRENGLQFADNFATVPRRENGVQFADNFATVQRGENGVQFADNTAAVPRGKTNVQLANFQSEQSSRDDSDRLPNAVTLLHGRHPPTSSGVRGTSHPPGSTDRADSLTQSARRLQRASTPMVTPREKPTTRSSLVAAEADKLSSYAKRSVHAEGPQVSRWINLNDIDSQPASDSALDPKSARHKCSANAPHSRLFRRSSRNVRRHNPRFSKTRQQRQRRNQPQKRLNWDAASAQTRLRKRRRFLQKYNLKPFQTLPTPNRYQNWTRDGKDDQTSIGAASQPGRENLNRYKELWAGSPTKGGIQNGHGAHGTGERWSHKQMQSKNQTLGRTASGTRLKRGWRTPWSLVTDAPTCSPVRNAFFENPPTPRTRYCSCTTTRTSMNVTCDITSSTIVEEGANEDVWKWGRDNIFGNLTVVRFTKTYYCADGQSPCAPKTNCGCNYLVLRNRLNDATSFRSSSCKDCTPTTVHIYATLALDGSCQCPFWRGKRHLNLVPQP